MRAYGSICLPMARLTEQASAEDVFMLGKMSVRGWEGEVNKIRKNIYIPTVLLFLSIGGKRVFNDSHCKYFIWINIHTLECISVDVYKKHSKNILALSTKKEKKTKQGNLLLSTPLPSK